LLSPAFLAAFKTDANPLIPKPPIPVAIAPLSRVSKPVPVANSYKPPSSNSSSAFVIYSSLPTLKSVPKSSLKGLANPPKRCKKFCSLKGVPPFASLTSPPSAIITGAGNWLTPESLGCGIGIMFGLPTPANIFCGIILGSIGGIPIPLLALSCSAIVGGFIICACALSLISLRSFNSINASDAVVSLPCETSASCPSDKFLTRSCNCAIFI